MWLHNKPHGILEEMMIKESRWRHRRIAKDRANSIDLTSVDFTPVSPGLPTDRPMWSDISGREERRREDLKLPNSQWKWVSVWEVRKCFSLSHVVGLMVRLLML